MAQKIKITTFIVILVFNVVTYINDKNLPKSCYDELTLKNVEALASGEGGNVAECFGLGSVDCPITKTGVSFIIKPTTIIEKY